MNTRTLSYLASLAVAVPVFVHASAAHAEDCGTVRATWNVPRGGAVFVVSGPGPVTAVINGIGETRTHSMLSLGATRVIHATARTPDARDMSEDGFCSTPVVVDQLQHGFPGATNISVSAAHDFVSNAVSLSYQNGNVFGPGTINDDQGRDVANYANTLPVDPPFTIDIPMPPFRGGGGPTTDMPHFLLLDGASRAPYVLDQYMHTSGRELGYAPAPGDGVVCSTLISFFQGRLAARGGFGSPDVIATHAYSHGQTTNAGYALYDSVKADCTTKRENNFFLAAGAFLYCGFRNPCAHAAAQVRNCMAFGGDQCANGDPDPFDSAVGDPSFAANSISPDWLAGYVAGQDYNGPHQSVWAKDYGHAVTWSVGGAAYACWD